MAPRQRGVRALRPGDAEAGTARRRRASSMTRSVRPWESTGWTTWKNVSQLLEFLWGAGQGAGGGSPGPGARLGSRASGLPPAPPLTPEDAAIAACRATLPRGRPDDRVGLQARAEAVGAAAGGRVPRASSATASSSSTRSTACAAPGTCTETSSSRCGRSAGARPSSLRSIPLVYDRKRAQELWSFRYKLEIYAPAAKREFGYFVLPILHRDRLVGADRPAVRSQDRRAPRGAGLRRGGRAGGCGAAIAKAIGESARGRRRPTSTTAASPRVWRRDFG